jgi:hypothetical protein
MIAIHKLENVTHREGKITARCPACAAADGDKSGRHLVIWPDTGKFACAAQPDDKGHRSLIWKLAGEHAGLAPLSTADRRALMERRNQEAAARRHAARLKDTAARKKAGILRDFAWPIAEIAKESPVQLDQRTATDWRIFIAALWPPDAVIWIGEKYDSGKSCHARHFRPVRGWVADFPRGGPPGPLTCPDSFNPGVISRAAANVAQRPFIVVEADSAIGYKPVTPEGRAANIAANLVLIRWLRDACRWHLCAIVHTGGKSCHGWFHRPPDSHIEDLKTIAPEWGLDSSLYAASQPVRLPGVCHSTTGQLSRCLYLG